MLATALPWWANRPWRAPTSSALGSWISTSRRASVSFIELRGRLDVTSLQVDATREDLQGADAPAGCCSGPDTARRQPRSRAWEPHLLHSARSPITPNYLKFDVIIRRLIAHSWQPLDREGPALAPLLGFVGPSVLGPDPVSALRQIHSWHRTEH